MAPYLLSGRLRVVLADWGLPPADVFLVYPTKSNMSAKTRALIDFLHERFAAHREGSVDGSQGRW